MSALYNLVIYEDLGRKSSFILAEGGKIDLEQVLRHMKKYLKKGLTSMVRSAYIIPVN